MTQMTESWWTAFREGDLNGFGRLIERYQDDVFAVALATVHDRALAEDVAQETFIAAYTCRERLRDPAAVGGWLAAIARNVGRDQLRARKRERIVDAPELDVASSGELPSQQLDRATLCRHVRRALERVPAKYREVLILYYSFERSIESIATSLGLSQAAALQRLSRGRKLVERHGASLREFANARPSRQGRSFVVAVLALLALRTRAEAAPSPSRLRRLAGKGSWVMGLAVVFAFASVDDASGQRAPTRPAKPPVIELAEPSAAPHRAPPTRVAAADEACPIAPTPPPPPAPRPRPKADAWPRSVAPPLPPPAPVPALQPLGLVEPTFECGTCVAVEVAAPPKRPQQWDIVNGYLETAAMPVPGDITYETIALGMIMRAGLTRHIAVHGGMIGMDIVRGDYKNAGSAFGGGIKLGASITPKLKVAVVAEGARNFIVKSLKVRDEWIGRAYASVTGGPPDWNVTLSAGVVGTDQGTVSALEPVIGIGSQLGWDDNLGFVIETQYFPRSYLGVDSTSVLAVRFRHHELPRNALRMEQVRIDVGALLIEKSDDTGGLPWVQVGLGW